MTNAEALVEAVAFAIFGHDWSQMPHLKEGESEVARDAIAVVRAADQREAAIPTRCSGASGGSVVFAPSAAWVRSWYGAPDTLHPEPKP